MTLLPFTPTLRAQYLGLSLQSLRVKRGLTLAKVAKALCRSDEAIGRYERAEWPITRPDVEALLDLYQVNDGDLRTHLLRLSTMAWDTNRWDALHRRAADTGFINVPWLASRSDRVRLYHPTLIPEIAQTNEYAEHLIRSTHPDRSTSVDTAMRARAQRVAAHGPETAIRLILHETVLTHRVTTDNHVMRKQWAHLVELTNRPGFEIRILPTERGPHPAVTSPFTVFDLPAPYPPVGHVRTIGGNLFLEVPHSTPLTRTHDHLWDTALNAKQSRQLIERTE